MNKFLKFLSFLIVLGIFVISCEENNSSSEASPKIAQDTALYATQSFSLPSLSPKAEALVADWPIFQEFEQEIKQLQKLRLEALTQRSEKLVTQTDSLSRTLPDTLNSQSINSRLRVVQTRLQLLIQEAKKGNPQVSEVNTLVLETQKAVRHFWFQINEKVEKDQIDLQQKEEEKAELEKQRKARDSIFKLELQDQ